MPTPVKSRLRSRGEDIVCTHGDMGMSTSFVDSRAFVNLHGVANEASMRREDRDERTSGLPAVLPRAPLGSYVRKR